MEIKLQVSDILLVNLVNESYEKLNNKKEKKSKEITSNKNEIERLDKRMNKIIFSCLFCFFFCLIFAIIAFLTRNEYVMQEINFLQSFLVYRKIAFVFSIIFFAIFLINLLVKIVNMLKDKKQKKKTLAFISNDQRDISAIDEQLCNFNHEKYDNEMQSILSTGKEAFNRYTNKPNENDLIIAAKAGHPYALLQIVVKTLGDEMTHFVPSYAGNVLRCFYGEKVYRNGKFKTIRYPKWSIAQYLLNIIEYGNKFKNYYDSCPYFEFKFFENIIKMSSYNVDRSSYHEYEKEAIKALKNSENSIMQLDYRIPKLVKEFFPLYGCTFDSEMWNRATTKVEEQLNPTAKPSDAEWVYVPDVSDV